MRNFYANYTVCGMEPSDIIAALPDRRSIITPAVNGAVVVFDEENEEFPEGLEPEDLLYTPEPGH